MANKKIWLGILVMALVFGMTVVGCGGDDDGSTNGNGGNGGSTISGMETLNLSGRVFLEEWNDDDTVTYRNYTGTNLTVSSEYGGSGTVTSGNLNFSIGTPTGVYTIDLEDDWPFYGYNSTPSTIRGVVLDILDITNSADYNGLDKINTTVSTRNNGYSYVTEDVIFVYVENDVTINGTGRTDSGTDTWDGVTETWNETTKNFTLALKAGWNSINIKSEGSYTVNEGTKENPIRVTYTETQTISLGNPALRWVLYEAYNYDDYSLMLNRSILNTSETRISRLKTHSQLK